MSGGQPNRPGGGASDCRVRDTGKRACPRHAELRPRIPLAKRRRQLQIEQFQPGKLLQLEKSSIRVAEYLTELPAREVLERQLHRAIELAGRRTEPLIREEGARDDEHAVRPTLALVALPRLRVGPCSA